MLFVLFSGRATPEIYTYGLTLSLHDALPILVVRRIADRLVDMTSERGLRDIARAIPGRIRKTPRERAVAGEGELTAGRPLRSLEDDPAHRLGESGMAD